MKKMAILLLAYRLGVIKFDNPGIASFEELGLGKKKGEDPPPPSPPDPPEGETEAEKAARLLSGTGTPPPPPPTPPSTPVFDFEKEFGKKPEEIKEVLTKYDEVVTTNKTLSEKAKLAEDLQAELDTVKNMRHIKNDNIYRLNALYEKDDTSAELTAKILYGGVTPEEILKMNYKLQNPEYKDDDAHIDAYIKAKYSPELRPEQKEKLVDEELTIVDDPDAIEYNKKQKLLAFEKMKEAAKEAKSTLLKEFNAIKLPKAKTKEDIDAETKSEKDKMDAFVSSWQKPFQEITSSFTTVKIEGRPKAGETAPVIFEYNIPAEQAKEVTKWAAKYIVEQGLELNDESKSYIRDLINYRFINLNLPEMFMSHAEKVRGMNDEEWKAFTNNPSIRIPEHRSAPPADKVTQRKEALGKVYEEI